MEVERLGVVDLEVVAALPVFVTELELTVELLFRDGRVFVPIAGFAVDVLLDVVTFERDVESPERPVAVPTATPELRPGVRPVPTAEAEADERVGVLRAVAWLPPTVTPGLVLDDHPEFVWVGRLAPGRL